MTKATQAIGAYGERLAAQHLVDHGMVILDRNWRCRFGEIDLIVRDGDILVFCEVKTRRGKGFGTPADAVVSRKVRRLRRLAAEWLATTGVRPAEVRFDVVSIRRDAGGTTDIEHLRAAF